LDLVELIFAGIDLLEILVDILLEQFLFQQSLETPAQI
jgi:hypothetical protein